MNICFKNQGTAKWILSDNLKNSTLKYRQVKCEISGYITIIETLIKFRKEYIDHMTIIRSIQRWWSRLCSSETSPDANQINNKIHFILLQKQIPLFSQFIKLELIIENRRNNNNWS